MIETRVCPRRKDSKPSSNYWKSPKTGEPYWICIECERAYRRQRHHANLEKSRETQRAKVKAWRSKPGNAAKSKAWSKRWELNNPEAAAAMKRAKRQRRRALESSSFVEDIDEEAMVKRTSGNCGICGLFVDECEYSVDHIVPLSKGGKHCNDNVQLAHVSCNKRKGAKV